MQPMTFSHLTGVTQPATGTGGSRSRGYLDLVRASLRTVPGPTEPGGRGPR
jgi:hypothetical protein